MKGVLNKLDGKWVVNYHNSYGKLKYMSIHPDEPIFVDGRWVNTEIEFDVVHENNIFCKPYAKNIEMVRISETDLDSNNTWLEIRQKFDESNYWRDHGLIFIDWLIENYEPPIKKIM
jgi:hypothetical protein